jgi:hypothetical protein
MKTLVKLLVLVISVAVATPAIAELLTFEGLYNNEQIGNYYNGGIGQWSGPGPNYGITFGSNSLAIISHALDPYGSGYFSGNPSGKTCLYFLNLPGIVMNVAAGYQNDLSFYYASAVYTANVTVYSGLDGTGSVLASLSLPPKSSYNTWTQVDIPFAGTARSAIFSDEQPAYILFDNITLYPIPEPGTLIPLVAGAIGLVGYGCLMRRKLRLSA